MALEAGDFIDLYSGNSARLVIIPPLVSAEPLAEGVDVKPQILITVASF